MTQAALLIQHIRAAKSQGMTWGEIEALRISTCPWVRLAESGHRHLRQGERLGRRTGSDGLVRVLVEIA